MKKIRIIILVFLSVLFVLLFFPLHVLQIQAVREGKTVCIEPITRGDRFAIGYLHSVELCSVWDFFTVDEQYRIVLSETTFSSCNTGLPAVLSAEEVFRVEKDQFRISNMHRVVKELSLWVDEKYNNTLKIRDGRTITLPELAGNTLLCITIKKVSCGKFAYLTARLMFE